MLVNGWAIGLMICSAGILFLSLTAAWCGVKVVRFWNHGADTSRQIKLEAEVWLTSALMKYGLFFQVISLVILVLAADEFSKMLVGSMCATGAFAANQYGLATLMAKIFLVFAGGFWLLVNHLDHQSENYPLVKFKYVFIFVLLPVLFVDSLLQFIYLVKLEPDVLTSCCGVIFRSSATDGFNLFDPYSPILLLGALYSLAVIIMLTGTLQLRSAGRGGIGYRLNSSIFAGGWLMFFPVAIWAITIYFSSYIYGTPSHRCPFDILQSNYSYVGYPIYFTLFSGTFFGSSAGFVQLMEKYQDLHPAIYRFRAIAIPTSMVMLLVFLVLTAYTPVRYLLMGGEVI